MVLCIDTSGIIYNVLAALTTNVTGGFFMSTMILSILLMAIAAAYKIPVEISMVLLLPLHLSLLSCFGNDWLSITGTILIYLGIVLSKNMFFR